MGAWPDAGVYLVNSARYVMPSAPPLPICMNAQMLIPMIPRHLDGSTDPLNAERGRKDSKGRR